MLSSHHNSNLFSKIAQYTEAELSRLFMKMAPDAIEARRSACRSCEHLTKPADMTAPKIGYCTGCGCPHWRRSELSVKTTAPRAKCPKGKWATYSLTVDGRVVS